MLFVPMTLREIRMAFGLLAAAALVLIIQAPARAQSPDDNNPAIEKITNLNKKALDAYNDLEFEEARKLLKQALDMCASAGLDKHPIAARTHIHMGVVLIAAKQPELGVMQFKKAIEIEPEIQVTKALANPEILEAFKEAGTAGAGTEPGPAGGVNATTPAPTPPAPEAVKGMQHTPITRAQKGKPITVSVAIGDDVTGYTKVFLEYRPQGAPEFEELEMKKSGNRYSAEIPAAATGGGALAYYIEADSDDEDADSIATSGSEDRPYTISLIASEVSGTSPKEPECEGQDCEEEEQVGPAYFVALMGGIGYGFTTGFGEINDANKVKAGFAPASVAQISPEIGYFISPNLRLSLQFRYQIVSGTTPLNLDKYLPPDYQAAHPGDVEKCGADHLCSTQTSAALAVLARGTWFFGAELIRPYFSLALGGGYIRHLVKFGTLGKVCGKNGDQTCVDTALSGPVFAGPGGGVLFAIMPNVGLLVDVTSVLGFPKFTYNFDLNGGVALRF